MYYTAVFAGELLLVAVVHCRHVGVRGTERDMHVGDRRKDTYRLLLMSWNSELLVGGALLLRLGGSVSKSIVFLPLHSTILEPDLYLTLTEAELVSDFNAATTSEVAVVVELLLQFDEL